MNSFYQQVDGRRFFFNTCDPRDVAEGREKIRIAKEIAVQQHERNGTRERRSLIANAKSIVEHAASAGLIHIERAVKFTPPPPDQVRAMAAKFCR